MSVRIMRSQKASMEENFGKLVKSIYTEEPFWYHKTSKGESFKKVILGGEPFEYRKNIYRGEFWESYEKLSRVESPCDTIRYLWKRVSKKLWKVSRLESPSDNIKLRKSELLQKGQKVLQSGTGFGCYKVGQLVLQSWTGCILQSGTILLQNETGITNWDIFITKWSLHRCKRLPLRQSRW